MTSNFPDASLKIVGVIGTKMTSNFPDSSLKILSFVGTHTTCKCPNFLSKRRDPSVSSCTYTWNQNTMWYRLSRNVQLRRFPGDRALCFFLWLCSLFSFVSVLIISWTTCFEKKRKKKRSRINIWTCSFEWLLLDHHCCLDLSSYWIALYCTKSGFQCWHSNKCQGDISTVLSDFCSSTVQKEWRDYSLWFCLRAISVWVTLLL